LGTPAAWSAWAICSCVAVLALTFWTGPVAAAGEAAGLAEAAGPLAGAGLLAVAGLAAGAVVGLASAVGAGADVADEAGLLAGLEQAPSAKLAARAAERTSDRRAGRTLGVDGSVICCLASFLTLGRRLLGPTEGPSIAGMPEFPRRNLDSPGSAPDAARREPLTPVRPVP
jgi:hypothetical protein